MIKFKTINFKTIFIRYRAKKDGNLIKEINDMNSSLSDSGTELKANAKDIDKVIDEALKKCSNEVEKVSVNDSNVFQLD
jgi:hypothetical protein